MAPADPATDRQSGFAGRVRDCFGRGAAGYERGAPLQTAVAARLGHLCGSLTAQLPPGPRADLGSGSGLLSRAIEAELPGPPLLRVDQCAELLCQEQLRDADVGQHQLLWDLNRGLPRQLSGAALLGSNFALQWLEDPERQLTHWCTQLRPGGWLVLAVPTSASFTIWRTAAAAAGVPFSGLELPDASGLEAVARRELRLERLQRLRFSRPNSGALTFLRRISAIGAQASRHEPLSAGALRRLIAHWPGDDQPMLWEVLLLIGQRP